MDTEDPTDSTTPTEALVREAQSGQRAAFDELGERFRARLLASIDACTGAKLRASIDREDVLQETLLRAWTSIDRFEWRDETALLGWLRNTARNVVLENARRLQRSLILPADFDPADPSPSASRVAARKERFARLEGSLAGLSEEHRQVILLARIERLPITEVAQRLGRSPDATSQLLRRALRKLTERFPETDSLGLPAEARLPSADDPETGSPTEEDCGP